MNKASSLLSCEEQVKKTGQLPGAGYEAGAGPPPQKAVPGPWLCEGAAIPVLGATAGPWRVNRLSPQPGRPAPGTSDSC